MAATDTMKNPWLTWALAAGLICGAAGVTIYYAPWKSGDDRLAGLTSSRPENRRAAAEALGRVEPEDAPAVVDALTLALKDEDATVRAIAARSLGSNLAVLRDLPNASAANAALDALLDDQADAVRASAALGLALQGRDSDKVFEGLLVGIRGADALLSGQADAALSTLDVSSPARLQRLFELAGQGPGPLRQAALLALDQVKPHGERAAVVAFLAGQLKGPDPTLQTKAAHALRLGSPGEAAAVPPLAEALATAPPEVRRAAAEALSAFTNLEEARAALTRALEDETADVRGAAALALARAPRPSCDAVLKETADVLGPEADTVAKLIDHLKNEDASRRVAAARGLGEIAPRSSSATDAAVALGRALTDADPVARIAIAQALARFGKPARDLEGVVPALKKASEDEHRAASAWALAALKLVDVPDQR